MSIKLQKAKKFAKNLHENQRRESGVSMYDHVLSVHSNLKRMGVKDEDVLIAALLHQSLSFSDEIKPEIKKNFGDEVLTIVANYDKLTKTEIDIRDSTQAFNTKYVIQTYVSLAKDMRVLIIRLADKVDNINTAFSLPKAKRRRIAERALNIYAPVSRLLGMMQFTKQLEDGAFKILHPRQYHKLEEKIKSMRKNADKFFAQTKSALQELLKERGINAKIEHRMKHIYGVHRKILKYVESGKKIGNQYENIEDIVAMRIIVETSEQCYQAESLLNQLWSPIPDSRDDYIQNPKASGYMSLHNTYSIEDSLNLEVQIKTKEMHETNEYGVASHVFYKIGDKFKENLKNNPDWIKDLDHWEREKSIKDKENQLTQFNDRVYVFTPKGDIQELPNGATVLDFAYNIHSKLGHKCIGAIVNDKIRKLSYVLENGDQIEMRTIASKKLPSADWLDIVVTRKAQNAIRKALVIK